MNRLRNYRKVLSAGAGFAVTVAAAGLGGHLFPSSWEPYLVAGIGVAASYGVFAARNVPPAGRHQLEPVEPLE